LLLKEDTITPDKWGPKMAGLIEPVYRKNGLFRGIESRSDKSRIVISP